MTRETKIGLLVSLAFVIAVGVLLSDHMVNNTDAKPVSVAAAGPQVAEGLAMPGQPAEGVATPVRPEANPTPVQPVPSVAEVVPPSADPGRNSVVVGAPSGKEIDIIKEATPNIAQRQIDIHIAGPTDQLAGPGNDIGVHQRTLGGPSPAVETPITSLVAAATQSTEKKHEDYVAVAGDNVAKMAKRFLGADTKANRDLIIAANDVLKKDPTKIVVGKTYRIPVKVAAPAPVVAVAPAPSIPAAMSSATEPAPVPAAVPAAAKTYVVKSGDNLWKIAKGNAQMVSEIRKLNRDALKGDNLRVGSTLRMPAKNAG